MTVSRHPPDSHYTEVNCHLSSQGTTKSHQVHRQRHVYWQISGLARGWVVVIETSQELGDGRNAAREKQIKRQINTKVETRSCDMPFNISVFLQTSRWKWLPRQAASKTYVAHSPEKVICISKKSHARDDDSGEVIGAGLGRIQRLEHVHVRHLRVSSSTLQRV